MATPSGSLTPPERSRRSAVVSVVANPVEAAFIVAGRAAEAR